FASSKHRIGGGTWNCKSDLRTNDKRYGCFEREDIFGDADRRIGRIILDDHERLRPYAHRRCTWSVHGSDIWLDGRNSYRSVWAVHTCCQTRGGMQPLFAARMSDSATL